MSGKFSYHVLLTLYIMDEIRELHNISSGDEKEIKKLKGEV